MRGAGLLCLIVLAMAAIVTSATLAYAESPKRMTGDAAAVVASAQTAPTYRRAAFAPLTTGAERTAWSRDRYARVIAEASAKHAVPERLIWAVIRVESGFNHRAVSRRGARGLMQLMPETASALGVRDAFDPYQNIQAGTRHLRAMLMRFPEDVRLAVAAYNAGEKAVVSFGGVPPYPETRNYVTRVMRLYGGGHDTGDTYVSALPRAAARATTRPAPARPVDDNPQQYGSDVQKFIAVDGTVSYTNIPGTRVASAR